jgi:hypothetical protein
VDNGSQIIAFLVMAPRADTLGRARGRCGHNASIMFSVTIASRGVEVHHR